MKKKSLLIILLLFISLFLTNLLYVKADSGWDSSYDGGGWSSSDSWSSSDWGSSSYDDYGSGYSSSSSGSLPGPVIFIIFVIIIIVCLSSNKNNKNNSSTMGTSLNEVNDEILQKYGIDRNEFKKMMASNYTNVQEGWMNFDYDKLKDLLTDELYNTYVSQLDALSIKEEKNIMSDIKVIDSKILNVHEENNTLVVYTYLRIEMYDYVVDKDNNVLRGTKSNKIDIEYYISYVKPYNKEIDSVCPSCGAEIKDITRGKCPYCKTLIVKPSNDFVMSKKTAIRQRRL